MPMPTLSDLGKVLLDFDSHAEIHVYHLEEPGPVEIPPAEVNEELQLQRNPLLVATAARRV